jgi:hypothetical protein
MLTSCSAQHRSEIRTNACWRFYYYRDIKVANTQDGLMGCPCAKNQAGQVGCASKELKCISGVCKASGTRSVLAVASLIVAILALFY